MLDCPPISPELFASLFVLALVDSTSFGTLLIPIWLLLAPGKPSARRILLFLATVAVFYLLLGVVLVAGLDRFTAELQSMLDLRPVRFMQLGVAAVLMVLGLTIEPWTKAGKAKKADRRAVRGPGRIQRWRTKAVTADGSVTGIVTLALTATAVEAASMVPYLAAIGLVAASGLHFAGSALVLAGYCLVMVLPAVGLLIARLVFHQRMAPLLEQVEGWMSRNTGEMTAWVLFLLGFYLAGDAIGALNLMG